MESGSRGAGTGPSSQARRGCPPAPDGEARVGVRSSATERVGGSGRALRRPRREACDINQRIAAIGAGWVGADAKRRSRRWYDSLRHGDVVGSISAERNAVEFMALIHSSFHSLSPDLLDRKGCRGESPSDSPRPDSKCVCSLKSFGPTLGSQDFLTQKCGAAVHRDGNFCEPISGDAAVTGATRQCDARSGRLRERDVAR